MALSDPRRGQIWEVCLDPTVGGEIEKTRPAVVVSSDDMSQFPVRLVVPLTEWKSKHVGLSWIARIEPTTTNGLNKIPPRAADPLQARCLSIDARRFKRCLGILDAESIEDVISGIAIVTEHR